MSLFLTVLLFISIFISSWMGIVIIGNLIRGQHIPALNIILFAFNVTYILFYVIVLPH